METSKTTALDLIVNLSTVLNIIKTHLPIVFTKQMPCTWQIQLSVSVYAVIQPEISFHNIYGILRISWPSITRSAIICPSSHSLDIGQYPEFQVRYTVLTTDISILALPLYMPIHESNNACLVLAKSGTIR